MCILKMFIIKTVLWKSNIRISNNLIILFKNFVYVSFAFVCFFGFFVPLENCSLIWRRHHCRWRAANFDLCSALVTIEQWGFFSMSHLLWHGASVYNGIPVQKANLGRCSAALILALQKPRWIFWHHEIIAIIQRLQSDIDDMNIQHLHGSSR